MPEFLKPAARDPFLRTAFIAMGGTLAAALVVALRFLSGFEHSALVIHYAPGAGADFIGTKRDFLNVWAVGALLTAADAAFALFWHPRARYMSYLFGFSGVALALLILIVTGAIIAGNQ